VIKVHAGVAACCPAGTSKPSCSRYVLTATLLHNGGARAMICRAVLHGPHHVLFSGAPQMPSAGWGCFHSRASSVAFVRSTAVAGCGGSVAAICLTIGTHALSRSSCWKSVRPAGVVCIPVTKGCGRCRGATARAVEASEVESSRQRTVRAPLKRGPSRRSVSTWAADGGSCPVPTA
jgi:hypothetical protein